MSDSIVPMFQADAVARLDKRLDEVMRVVKLTGLIEREGGWAAVASWGDTMSLGARLNWSIF